MRVIKIFFNKLKKSFMRFRQGLVTTRLIRELNESEKCIREIYHSVKYTPSYTADDLVNLMDKVNRCANLIPEIRDIIVNKFCEEN